MELQRINYDDLTAKQKEIYNFQKIAALLADYGFNCIKLSDDWQGADFLAYHKDGEQTLKVQLKGRRVGIYNKYQGKGLWMAFRIGKTWYLVPRDELVRIAGETTPWLSTASWHRGRYSSAKPSNQMLTALIPYSVGTQD